MTYILVGQTPVPEPDPVRFSIWFEEADRQVAEDRIGPYWVTTIFLGLDHQLRPGRPPLLFETMIFGIKDDDIGYCSRCTTWLEAEKMHRIAVEHAKRLIHAEK